MFSVIKILVLLQLIYKLNFIPIGFLKEFSKQWFQTEAAAPVVKHMLEATRRGKEAEQKGMPHSGIPAYFVASKI